MGLIPGDDAYRDFFHYQKGHRLKDFRQALEGICHIPSVFLYDAYYPPKLASSFELKPVAIQTIYQVHSSESECNFLCSIEPAVHSI
jgi:hypothetical protein